MLMVIRWIEMEMVMDQTGLMGITTLNNKCQVKSFATNPMFRGPNFNLNHTSLITSIVFNKALIIKIGNDKPTNMLIIFITIYSFNET